METQHFGHVYLPDTIFATARFIQIYMYVWLQVNYMWVALSYQYTGTFIVHVHGESR